MNRVLKATSTGFEINVFIYLYFNSTYWSNIHYYSHVGSKGTILRFPICIVSSLFSMKCIELYGICHFLIVTSFLLEIYNHKNTILFSEYESMSKYTQWYFKSAY